MADITVQLSNPVLENFKLYSNSGESGNTLNNYIPILRYTYQGEWSYGDRLLLNGEVAYKSISTYPIAFGCLGTDKYGVFTGQTHDDSDFIKIEFDTSTLNLSCNTYRNNVSVASTGQVQQINTWGGSGFYGYRVVDTSGNTIYFTISQRTAYYTNASNGEPTIPALGSKGVFSNLSEVTINPTLNNESTGYILESNVKSNNVIFDSNEILDVDDPYDSSESSGENGGNGSFNYDSDDDDIPDLPTVTVADSGFVTLYAPTAAQLKALSQYLWSDAFSIDTFKKLFNNPIDCILGLSLVPVNLPHGSAKEITVGNVISTVSCDQCTSQYVKVDCGSIEVSAKSFTNSYLDFSPYTQISLYLPFIGTQPLDADEVMNSTINVVYHIDVLTGAMCCYVNIKNTNPINKKSATHVLYTYMGQCCESVPLSSDSWGNTIGSILNAAASIGGVVATAATGGAAAPAAVGMLAGATTATSNAMQSMKPTVNHSGSMGGGGGMMAQRVPKLIMKAPYISKPKKQYKYTGYPVNQTKTLSDCKGFTIIDSVNLSVSGATQNELSEIETLLRQGVII